MKNLAHIIILESGCFPIVIKDNNFSHTENKLTKKLQIANKFKRVKSGTYCCFDIEISPEFMGDG